LYYYPPTTVVSTLSLHDALPISEPSVRDGGATPAVDGGELALDQSATDEQAHDSPLDAGVSKSEGACGDGQLDPREDCDWLPGRSEEHTSELQSRENLVCRLLLE